MARRIAAVALLVAVAGALAGCFEDPVEETLRIELAADGSAWVDLAVQFHDDRSQAADSPLGRRLAGEREALLGGWDEWSARFSALTPVTETHSWIKDRGALVSLTRSARVADAAALGDFFADTGIGAFAERGEDWASFALYPGRSARASSAEVRRIEDTVAEWSEHIARYLEATGELYAYLDRHPDRARVCFAHYFEDVVPEARLDPLDAEEEALLSDLVERSGELLGVFEVPAGEAWTLNELSRRVLDPFPADVAVRVPGRALEVEGFTVGGDGWLHVPGIGLWPALTALEGTWVTPDPALAWVRAETAASSGESGFSLDAFLATPWRVDTVPEADEVEDALWDGLQPAAAYRVVWASAGRG